MTIFDNDKFVNCVSDWISNYLKTNHKTCAVINFNLNRNDMLLLHIGKQICKNGFNLEVITFDINISIQLQSVYNGKKTNIITEDNNISGYSFIKSHLIANSCNGIVLGAVDKTYGLHYRQYSKLEEYTADIFPLYNVEYSDIVNLTNSLYPQIQFDEKNEYDILEWCLLADKRYNIISGNEIPHKHNRWPYFTQTQKEWIAKVYNREKSTRHKKLDNKPSVTFEGLEHIICSKDML
ncbi:MAG: hypothetical protein WC942_06550 [Clostridia bacterium]|jgi:hypothetical protein